MSDDDQDKSHQPTERKLEKAREKGDMPKTADMTSALMLSGHWIFTVLFGQMFIVFLGGKLSDLFERTEIENAGFALQLFSITFAVYSIPVVLIIVFLTSQKAIVFAPSKLALKFDRLSPISNAKQKFGISGLIEFVKSFAKLLIFIVLLSAFLVMSLPSIVQTSALSAGQGSTIMLRLFVMLLGAVALISLALGGLDYLWQKFDHKRKLRMSYQELKDEQKESEGDPQMKQTRRQKAMDIAMNQMIADVPKADVIIVNPTHYSVALAWSRDSGRAPECVAKGRDEVALKIREIAQKYAIPIHSDPPTARAIFATVEIGQDVRPEHYQTVAAAIRFADRMRRKI